ncbi:MAG TPA: glycosyltransferase, partial [Bryobacteraceae bacterium]
MVLLRASGLIGPSDDDQTLAGSLQRLRDGLRDGNADVVRQQLDLIEHAVNDLKLERGELRRRLKRLEWLQRNLDQRLVPLERSLVFRALRAIGAAFGSSKRAAGQLLLHSPFHPVFARLFAPGQNPYHLWLEREREFEAERSHPGIQPAGLRISIVMPIRNPRREWLESAVDSVLSQSYENWELCACDDASNDSWVVEYLETKSVADRRIRFVRSEEPLGISGALNRAGALATGEYVGFLDHDDVLEPFALKRVAEAIAEHTPALVYSDEDVLDGKGARTTPVFKPDWDPELLLSGMYLGHFLVVSRARLEQSGWFRSEFDGSQDYDLALRVTDQESAVCHIPSVLYHWRQHELSTCNNPDAKPYTHAAGRRALQDAILRRGLRAKVEDGPGLWRYRLRREIQGEPLASIIICSRNAKLLERCLRAIASNTEYARREIVVVQHKTGDTAAMDRLLDRVGCTRVTYEGPFNFSVMNNRGAVAAAGEILVFLNDDVEPIAPEWLGALIAQAQRPGVGIVGARLLYPSGAIQHAGVAIGIVDGAGHPHRFCSEPGYWPWSSTTRNVSAVTGACLAIRKEAFLGIHGFEAEFPMNYNDVDLCLRIRKAGYAVLLEAGAVLRHYEAQTRKAVTTYK